MFDDCMQPINQTESQDDDATGNPSGAVIEAKNCMLTLAAAKKESGIDYKG